MASTASKETNRRTRIESTVSPQLREWLTRTTRIHSHLCAVVRLLGTPSAADQRAGGQTVTDQNYADRVRAGDPTILHDALTLAADLTAELLADVQTVMDDAPSCPHPPGSAGKIAAMQERACSGRSLFIPGDAPADIR